MYIAPRIKQKYPNSIIVFLGADARILDMDYYNYSKWGNVENWFHYADLKFDKFILSTILRKYIDGAIAMSDLYASQLKGIDPSLPIRVAHPFVTDEKQKCFSRISPDLSSNNVVTLCGGRFQKGVDYLVESWPRVKDNYPDASLTIIGRGHPQHYEDIDGVTVTGYLEIEEIAELFSSASLLVHPAIADAFPVSVLEGMTAGLPPIVTETTGTGRVLQEVDQSMVVEMNVDSISEGICEYLSYTKNHKRQISNDIRKISEKYKRENIQKEFIQAREEISKEFN